MDYRTIHPISYAGKEEEKVPSEQPTVIQPAPVQQLGLFNHTLNIGGGENEPKLPENPDILKRGPVARSRILGIVSLSWSWIAIGLLIVANTVLACFFALDVLAVGFLRPIIPLIFHIVLFILFLLLAIIKTVGFIHERLLEDKLALPFISIHFAIYNLFGAIALLIFTAKFGDLASKLVFANDPLAYISYLVISGCLLLWFIICITIITIMSIVRYNQSKIIEIMGVASSGNLSRLMSKYAMSVKNSKNG